MTGNRPPGLAPALIPHGWGTGKYTEKILQDRFGMYYCAKCDFTSATYAKVMGHSAAHSEAKKLSNATGKSAKTRRAEARAAGIPVKVGTREGLINQALQLLTLALTAEDATYAETKRGGGRPPLTTEAWRTRALTAEKQLKQIKKSLGLPTS